jgi:SAM-dependent methyltransferase
MLASSGTAEGGRAASLKPGLVRHLRCLTCRAALQLSDRDLRAVEAAGATEVLEGTLECVGCEASYSITAGVPRMRAGATQDVTRLRTAASFGYLWAKSTPGADAYDVGSYHFAKMESSLTFDPPKGLVLDAGCGDGIDLANQSRRAGVEAIGVELSNGGCETSYLRTRELPAAHVVQADLCRLPFADGTFDFAYSYGVLHHLGAPELGLREIVRVAKPGARIVAYLYEDFGERSAVLYWSLKAANSARALTTRLPHAVLYNLCRVASPVVFALFTVPALLARRMAILAPLADNLPFRHGTGPFSLVGDLYDRFSTPVEFRYSRSGSKSFFADAGLDDVTVAFERGWMVSGIKRASIEERGARMAVNHEGVEAW